jgi:NAD(P)-dependent dehydrogenase (short-subunit alcohol dehydrogenase family)
MPSFADKTAIVTGAARGIGRAIAEGLARTGARVAVADRDGAGASDVAAVMAASGATALAIEVDVAQRAQVDEMVRRATEALGVPDVLVTSAGVVQAPGTEDVLALEDGEWDRVIGINLRGTFLCAQAVARALTSAGRAGAIVAVSSIGASRPVPGGPVYHTSKGGVEGMTRALAINLAPYGIRVNAIAPGYILTDMTRDPDGDPAAYDELLQRIPLYRMGQPEDLVGPALLLASDAAAYVTGQVILVDGGAAVLGAVPALPPLRPAAPGGAR